MVHYVEVKRTMHHQFLSYNIYRFHGLNIGHQVLCQLPLSDEPPCQQNKIKNHPTKQQNNPKAWVWRDGLVVSAHTVNSNFKGSDTLI